LQALGAELPVYGHLPMIHGPDGQKLSKRHGAVSVLQYEELGYLPEAVVNYLARLGWSHGDEEIFTREQLVQWFDGEHLSHSPSQLDFDKFRWVNQQYLKAMADDVLAQSVLPRLQTLLAALPDDAVARLPAICGLWKDRASTLQELTELAAIFFTEPAPPPDLLAKHLTAPARAGVALLREQLATCEWSKEAIAACLKGVLAEAGLKMPHLAVPVRLLVFGREQTPSVDAMLAQMPRQTVLARLAR
jgi:glutamyl-tRNA synthetase